LNNRCIYLVSLVPVPAEDCQFLLQQSLYRLALSDSHVWVLDLIATVITLKQILIVIALKFPPLLQTSLNISLSFDSSIPNSCISPHHLIVLIPLWIGIHVVEIRLVCSNSFASVSRSIVQFSKICTISCIKQNDLAKRNFDIVILLQTELIFLIVIIVAITPWSVCIIFQCAVTCWFRVYRSVRITNVAPGLVLVFC
jgi:hypothetical protein